MTLTGWLYTSAHFAAAKVVRTEDRRHDREEKFMREPIHENAPGADWEKIRPALDDAMHELKETDREVILLRYFENRPFADVGAKFGLNENAARMRVERALEKLRDIFARRGITTATALASAISANAIQIAPANLTTMLATTSIASAGTGTFTLLKIMTATKLKLAFSALIVAGVATALVVQHQAQEKLRAENELLTQQIAQLQTDNENLSNRLAAIGDSRSLSDERFNELLRLRGEVTRLRQIQNNSHNLSQLETNSLNSTLPLQIHVSAKFVSILTDDLASMNVIWMANENGVRTGILTEDQFKVFNEALSGASDANVLGMPQVTSINGQQVRMLVTQPIPVGGTNTDVGMSLEMIPDFSTNSSTFDLGFIAKLNQLTGDISQPDVQTTVVTNRITLPVNQTVVLEKEIPSGGWLPWVTNTVNGSRSLLVFVTPTIVDARGNPLNFPPPNQ